MKRIKKNNISFLYSILATFCILFFASCGGSSDYTPKPKGYYRIDLPKKQYVVFDSTYPFTFEYPVYAKVSPDKDKNAEPFWMNIDFPTFKGKIHISYKMIKHNLSKFSDDAYNLAMKHIPKATNIDDELIDIKEHKVYGMIYNIEGEGAASTYQFFVSDSTSNFVRGALYFNVKPNNDSLSPVIDFIKLDIQHLIKSLRWKKV
jgi:gliding motility-associated lipoprotein GldD